MTPAVRAACALAGFASVGLLAAGFLDSTPESARAVVALVGVIAAPAMVLAASLTRFAAGGVPFLVCVLPASAVLLLSLHAVLAQVFVFAGTRFSLYATITTWLLLGACGAILARELGRVRGMKWRGVRARRGVRTGLALTAALLALSALYAPRYTGAEDAYDHMGYVRRVIALDSMQPDGVLAQAVNDAALPPDPRKGAFHATVALCAHIAGADPVVMWKMLRVVMFPLTVLAFAGFTSAFVGTGAALAVCMLLFFLSYSGTALQLVNASSYGQNLAAVWYWVLAGLVLRGVFAAHPRALVPGLCAAGGVFVHFGLAVHLAVFAATLLLFPGALGMKRAAAWRVSVWFMAGAAGALAARLVSAGGLPSANEIHAHAQGIMTVGGEWFVMSPVEILRQHGMVFLGGIVLLPLTAVAARSDPRARAVLAVSLLPVAVALVPPLATFAFEHASYMAFRALLNAPVYAVVVVTVAWLVRKARSSRVPARATAALLLAGWAVVFVAPALRAFARDAAGLGRADGRARYAGLNAAVADLATGSTILSDPVTAYELSAVTSHRFVAIFQQHANPADARAVERLRAVRDALSPYVNPHAAVTVCREYRVSFVVLSGIEWGIATDYLTPGNPLLYGAALRRLQSMPELFREVETGDGYAIFRFDPRGIFNDRWSGVEAPVRAETGPGGECGVEVPGELFDITGFAVEPATVAPGDALTVTLGYRRNRVSSYGTPLRYHFRFDHESVPVERGWPGDKHARRSRERRAGVLLRFRADERPGHGVFEPDLWPIGTDLAETFYIRVPGNAAPGKYRAEVSVVEETLLPNIDVTDLLYNRDRYSGVACGAIRVTVPERTR